MLDFLKTDTSIIIIFIINIILFIGVIVSYARINKINKNMNEFMKKLGDGKDIREDLSKYMDRVTGVETVLKETNLKYDQLDDQIQRCVQKIGVVRYNAYKDSGSDLSFAVALLDENNNGVVFNGIYSREMSNIYAKPVFDGKSKYTITDEENQAIDKAINFIE